MKWPHKTSRCPECGVKQGDIDDQPCNVRQIVATGHSDKDRVVCDALEDQTDEKPCCRQFVKAQDLGTDNEGYFRLVYDDASGNLYIGCGLPPIRFCPWCGERLEIEGAGQ